MKNTIAIILAGGMGGRFFEDIRMAPKQILSDELLMWPISSAFPKSLVYKDKGQLKIAKAIEKSPFSRQLILCKKLEISEIKVIAPNQSISYEYIRDHANSLGKVLNLNIEVLKQSISTAEAESLDQFVDSIDLELATCEENNRIFLFADTVPLFLNPYELNFYNFFPDNFPTRVAYQYPVSRGAGDLGQIYFPKGVTLSGAGFHLMDWTAPISSMNLNNLSQLDELYTWVEKGYDVRQNTDLWYSGEFYNLYKNEIKPDSNLS
jgi:hypothetical protein